jgi:RNA polymerase sigma factor (sigma-70 family)
MPRKHKRLYLSDLRFEPQAKCPSALYWSNKASAWPDRDEIRRAVDSLPQKERIVITQRFGLDGPPVTLEEIGRFLGCTRERVRQVEVKALDNLKRRLTQT